MAWITSPESWIALLTLTILEIVLGIDNIVFISILSEKLPEDQEKIGRRLGLIMAMVMRIVLLSLIAWLTRLTAPLFEVFSHAVSGRDLIMMGGGLFLIGKSTYEIHERLEGEEGHASQKVTPSLASVVIQIMLLDVVFSIDSVITAVGMADELAIMIIAVIIAVSIMLVAAGPISDYIDARPTLKILALSFLLLIGFSLVAEGLAVHIPKGYIYFAMGFSIFVEVLHLRLKAKRDPVKLRKPFAKES